MARYRYETQSRVSLLFPFAVMGAALVGIVVLAIALQTWGALAFVVLVALIGVFAGSQLLGRISHRLELDGPILRWFTPLSRGEVAVADIVSITQGLSGRETIFALEDGDEIVCMTRRGIVEFADLVAGDRGIPVDVQLPVSQRVGFTRDHLSRLD